MVAYNVEEEEEEEEADTRCQEIESVRSTLNVGKGGTMPMIYLPINRKAAEC